VPTCTTLWWKTPHWVTRELLEGAFSNPTHRLHGFVSEVATLADPAADPASRKQALAAFAMHDDVWWMAELREHAPPSAMRELVLARRPGPLSLWKRVSEFPGGPPAVEELNKRLPARGDPPAEQAWRQLELSVRTDHGVILNRVRFTPVEVDATGTSLLRVGDTTSASQPLSELSPPRPLSRTSKAPGGTGCVRPARLSLSVPDAVAPPRSSCRSCSGRDAGALQPSPIDRCSRSKPKSWSA
jgi:hypothetical protein